MKTILSSTASSLHSYAHALCSRFPVAFLLYGAFMIWNGLSTMGETIGAAYTGGTYTWGCAGLVIFGLLSSIIGRFFVMGSIKDIALRAMDERDAMKLMASPPEATSNANECLKS